MSDAPEPERPTGAGPQEPPPLQPPGAPVNRTLVQHAKRVIRIVTAFILIVVGALFGFVPLVPGWPLGLLGLSMLAADFVWARRMMKRIREGATSIKEAALWKRRRPKD